MITLARDRETQYKIVYAKDATAAELHAAEELKRFLEEITGARFFLYAEDERMLDSLPVSHLNALRPSARKTRIYVGDEAFGARVGHVSGRPLGKEGFSLKTEGEALFLIGGRPRGVLYGVYTFLEKYCGCRWFTQEVSRIPKRRELLIDELDDTQVPVLEYREPYYSSYVDADWHARIKCNGNTTLLGEAQGGAIRYHPFVHTFNDILNPEEYFDSHPEYFSEIDGKRACPDGRMRTQLCLTNPEVLALAKAKVRQWIRENPQAKIISVSQNDWTNYCTCPACRALDEREGSHMGSLLAFVNAIAEDIEADYPDVAIDTLAYQYTRKPPKFLRPRPNVIIRLCSIECCFAHPLGQCEKTYWSYDGCDQSFAEDLRDWGKICNRLYVWDYVVNFHHNLLPHPNFDVLQPNIRFFVENNVKGIFEQGNSFIGKYGEFDQMKQYVLAKLLWDPDCDMNTVVNEYLYGVYGAAAGEVRHYYDALRGLIKPDVHMHIYENPDTAYLTDEFIAEADACLARAERAAEDDETLKRVKTLRLSVYYAMLFRMDKDAPEREALLEQFEKGVRDAGIMTFYFRQKPERGMEFLRAGDMRFGH